MKVKAEKEKVMLTGIEKDDVIEKEHMMRKATEVGPWIGIERSVEAGRGIIMAK